MNEEYTKPTYQSVLYNMPCSFFKCVGRAGDGSGSGAALVLCGVFDICVDNNSHPGVLFN